MPLPNATFDPAQTVVAQKSYIKVSPVGGGQPIELIINDVTYDQSSEFIKREVPAADGLIRPDRIVRTKASESFKAVIEDVKKIPSVFGGNKMAGALNGTAELWMKDPDDAAGKAAFHVAQFKCLITLDGSVSFKGTEFSKGSIKIDALEATTWAGDYTVI